MSAGKGKLLLAGGGAAALIYALTRNANASDARPAPKPGKKTAVQASPGSLALGRQISDGVYTTGLIQYDRINKERPRSRGDKSGFPSLVIDVAQDSTSKKWSVIIRPISTRIATDEVMEWAKQSYQVFEHYLPAKAKATETALAARRRNLYPVLVQVFTLPKVSPAPAKQPTS